MRRAASAVALVVFLVARPALGGAGRAADVFPFVRGTTWTYAGSVRWTHHGNKISRGAVRRTSVVTDAFDRGDVAAALLRGGVWDLFHPDDPPGDYMLLRIDTRYYVVYQNAKQTFAGVKRSGRKALAARRHYEIWFEAPLRPGPTCRPTKSQTCDDWEYGWSVEKAPTAYVLRYRTLASDGSATIVPGVGITAFSYVHHGTVSEVDVHLSAYHRPGTM